MFVGSQRLLFLLFGDLLLQPKGTLYTLLFILFIILFLLLFNVF